MAGEFIFPGDLNDESFEDKDYVKSVFLMMIEEFRDGIRLIETEEFDEESALCTLMSNIKLTSTQLGNILCLFRDQPASLLDRLIEVADDYRAQIYAEMGIENAAQKEIVSSSGIDVHSQRTLLRTKSLADRFSQLLRAARELHSPRDIPKRI